ncbi:helix-turn-helix domain-containing protein [Bosea vaviloviae]|uniref:helix-turn-helix domain-containing protein n=1 Tax=Bosea vaviloviae TaxID=1526658 RepID=UPI0018D05E37
MPIVHGRRGKDLLGSHTDFAQRLSALSLSQLEILSLADLWYLNKEVAWRRGIAEAAVKTHIYSILKKFGLKSRTQAAVQFAIF